MVTDRIAEVAENAATSGARRGLCPTNVFQLNVDAKPPVAPPAPTTRDMY